MYDLLSSFLRGLESQEMLLELVEATMENTAVVLERVLLDGGPHRLFVIDDVRVIEGDKDKLKQMFVGDGSGVDPRKVEYAFHRIEDVLVAMELETKTLIENFKVGQETRPGEPPAKAWLDRNVIVRVLAHRRERSASKFLKKEFNMKKAEG